MTLHIRCQCLEKVLEQVCCKRIDLGTGDVSPRECRVSLTSPLCSGCARCLAGFLSSVSPCPHRWRLSSRKAALKPQPTCPHRAPACITPHAASPVADANLQSAVDATLPSTAFESWTSFREAPHTCWEWGAQQSESNPDLVHVPPFLSRVTWGSHLTS